jgi:hypothetical protein
MLRFCPRIFHRSDIQDGTGLSTFTTRGDDGPRRLIMLGAEPAPELHTIHRVTCRFRRIYLLRAWVNNRQRKGRGVAPRPRDSLG